MWIGIIIIAAVIALSLLLTPVSTRLAQKMEFRRVKRQMELERLQEENHRRYYEEAAKRKRRKK